MGKASTTLFGLLSVALALSGAKAEEEDGRATYASEVIRKLSESKPTSQKWGRDERCVLNVTVTPMGYMQRLDFAFCADETRVKMMEILARAQPLPRPKEEAWATMKIHFAGGI